MNLLYSQYMIFTTQPDRIVTRCFRKSRSLNKKTIDIWWNTWSNQAKSIFEMDIVKEFIGILISDSKWNAWVMVEKRSLCLQERFLFLVFFFSQANIGVTAQLGFEQGYICAITIRRLWVVQRAGRWKADTEGGNITVQPLMSSLSGKVILSLRLPSCLCVLEREKAIDIISISGAFSVFKILYQWVSVTGAYGFGPKKL